VQDRLEPPAGGGVGEDDLAQAAAVEAAVGAEHARAEGGHDLGERRLPGLDDLPGDEVGVDDGDAERGKELRDRGLATRDASGEGDAEGRQVSPGRHLHRQRCSASSDLKSGTFSAFCVIDGSFGFAVIIYSRDAHRRRVSPGDGAYVTY
jgi:hypothetical protein